ncbi:MAG TPA: flagellar basal-body rod protein FlgG [Ramlibacter sp.]|nr:flagellar basal-body rod protein FlgG [Ramlibacter sp.]
MSSDALYIAATGMQAQQLSVDTIANNLANVNTPGFKKSRVAFSDLVTGDLSRLPRGTDAEAGPLAAPQRLGAGVVIAKMERLLDAGDVKQTGNALDVAIQGAGFLEVAMPDGTRAYTRGGSLKINNEGWLTTATGHTLKPGIQVPPTATNLTITPAGAIKANVPGHAQPLEIGQLELVRFANPAMLQSLGEGAYRVTEASGEAITARPGQDDAGTIVQGMLEGSNVKLVDEMVSLMVAQRAYEASVKVIQASDEMLGMVNNLRK